MECVVIMQMIIFRLCLLIAEKARLKVYLWELCGYSGYSSTIDR